MDTTSLLGIAGALLIGLALFLATFAWLDYIVTHTEDTPTEDKDPE